MNIISQLKKQLPPAYLEYLQASPEEMYELDDVMIYMSKELNEKIEMIGVGESYKYNKLTLYIKFLTEIGFSDIETPKYSREEIDRINAGFVFGAQGEYFEEDLYFDISDNCSVWVFNSENGLTKKMANSFQDFLELQTQAK